MKYGKVGMEAYHNMKVTIRFRTYVNVIENKKGVHINRFDSL